MAVPGDRERIVRLETRAREAETAIQQLRSYIELLKKKSGEFCTQLQKKVFQFISPTPTRAYQRAKHWNGNTA